jgi:ketosteroid isomerase-like protein
LKRAIPRAVVEAFYHALSIRDMDALARFLDDDVVWTISGPVDILPFCGQRIGKDLVMKLLGRDSPTLLSGRRFVAKTMLVDGDRAAVLGRLTATKRASGSAMKRSSTTYRSSIVTTRSSRCSVTAWMPMTATGSKEILSPYNQAH